MDDIHQQAEFVIFFNEIGWGRYFCLLQGQVSGVTHQDNPEYVTVVVSVLPIQFTWLGEINHVEAIKL